ncbi:MAG: hypothetical protein GWN71_33295, partial [Gammaproteobacteria bacterium]|nr:hypothetical protein [Gammaproteobacteria bacterium]
DLAPLTLTRAMTFSPDGRWIAFETDRKLWLRGIGDFEAAPVRGAAGDIRAPAFSPDSQSLAFWVDGQFRRTAVSGGAPVTIGSAQVPHGAIWA